MRIMGNINGRICRVLFVSKAGIVTYIDEQTGKKFRYGLEALKHCNITVLKK
jgi:hypothetical protein